VTKASCSLHSPCDCRFNHSPQAESYLDASSELYSESLNLAPLAPWDDDGGDGGGDGGGDARPPGGRAAFPYAGRNA